MKKLILSIITLCISCLTFFLVCYAWYVDSTSSKVDDFILNIGQYNYDYEFYQYLSGEWNLKDSSTSPSSTPLVCNNLIPNSISYFALKIRLNDVQELDYSIAFDNISSSLLLSHFKPYESGDTHIYLKDNANNLIPIYELTDGKVIVDNEILYEIIDNQITLSYYQIENVMKTYVVYYGNDRNFDEVELNIDNLTGKNLFEPVIENVKISNVGEFSLVFGVEFNNQLSEENGGSNCYQFQRLLIEHLFITAKE